LHCGLCRGHTFFELQSKCVEALRVHNQRSAGLETVAFAWVPEAIEHMARLVRILQQPGRSALLLGTSVGHGRHTLARFAVVAFPNILDINGCRLACHLADVDFYDMPPTRAWTPAAFRSFLARGPLGGALTVCRDLFSLPQFLNRHPLHVPRQGDRDVCIFLTHEQLLSGLPQQPPEQDPHLLRIIATTDTAPAGTTAAANTSQGTVTYGEAPTAAEATVRRAGEGPGWETLGRNPTISWAVPVGSLLRLLVSRRRHWYRGTSDPFQSDCAAIDMWPIML